MACLKTFASRNVCTDTMKRKFNERSAQTQGLRVHTGPVCTIDSSHAAFIRVQRYVLSGWLGNIGYLLLLASATKSSHCAIKLITFLLLAYYIYFAIPRIVATFFQQMLYGSNEVERNSVGL